MNLESLPDINISDINAYSYNELLELCEFNNINDIQITNTSIEGLKYLKIENIMKNPLDLRNFLLKYPTEDKNRSITEGEGHSFSKDSKSPGIQQPIERQLLPSIGNHIYFLAKRLNFLKYNKKDITWKYYTNAYYNGMTSWNKNYLPHVDPFSYAANIFLTHSPNTSTSFYRVRDRVTNQYFYGASSICQNPETRERHKRNLQERYDFNDKMFCPCGRNPWVKYEGDDYYERYFHIPSTFNTLVMYMGRRWHTPCFDAVNEKKVRYSLVAVIE
jgi:hypothetical protein|tara:strand:+ start:1072 stop:1893 length:822 start_codon:yes stop_codon:yes gene_type:complete